MQFVSVLTGLFQKIIADPATEQLKAYLQKNVRDYRPSYIVSLDDERYQPSRRLLQLATEVLTQVPKLDLTPSLRPFKKNSTYKFFNTWPGEHYLLLAALMKVLKPKKVIEIGTAAGASALVMKSFLPKASELVTYDVIPWHEYPETGLKKNDFSEHFQQKVLDLTSPEVQASERAIFETADFIFVDAEKDYKMEKTFIEFFDSLKFRKPPIIMFDDIRLIQMVEIWRKIKHPKLDLTSFGHWSGTGLVEWK